jgi:hypothetical protein
MLVLSIPLASANTTKGYTFDRNGVLVSAQVSAGRAVLSTDPALLMTTMDTPPAAAGPRNDIIALLSTSSGTPSPISDLSFPVFKGMTIYLANSAVAWVILALAEPLSAENLVT